MKNTVVSSRIVQHSIKGVYDLKKIVVNNNSTTATQIEKTYGELIYSFIMNKINTILSSNNIIKTPILYHNNIYYVDYATESLINPIIQKELNDTDIGVFINYNKDKPEKYNASIKTANQSIELSKSALSNNSYVTSFVTDFIFDKSAQIITILNNQLNKHNIKIKKAELGFCYKLGNRNVNQDIFPELLLEYIFLKPMINVFQHFEFVELNNSENIITDATVIYKALSDKSNIDIEAYKLKEDVVNDFISVFKL
jgi:hypothetical protein